MHARAAELITRLELRPHPEGGYYRELHRSNEQVRPMDGRPLRPALTTIYFLLTEGTHSRWHRVKSDEVWHLYEGGPLELLLTAPIFTEVEHRILGPAGSTERRVVGPVHTVPAGWWQAARPLGPYALAGCTVGPGFDFADFSFLRDAPSDLARLDKLDAGLAMLA